MVPITALWLPILLAAVLVFFASFVAHMVLPWHRSDRKKLADEEGVLAALRKFPIPPGDYFFPCVSSPKEMKEPAFLEKMKAGPVGVVTFLPAGPPNMGKALGLWFVYCLAVGVLAGYVTGLALGPGVPYRIVFRFVSTVAFVGYSAALWQETIWYGRSWVTTLKSTVDGFAYAFLTAGVFGWLWPK